MATNAIYTVRYRRKREGRTHYKRRLELLKGAQTRLVIRRTNTETILQFTDYAPDGDLVRLTYNSGKLESAGWKYSKKSIPANYLAGYAIGKLALEKGIKSAIVDLGLQTPIKGSRLYAAVKGVIDAGVDIPHSEDIFPSEDRLRGEDIAKMGDLAETATRYKKLGLKVEDIPSTFDAVKKNL